MTFTRTDLKKPIRTTLKKDSNSIQFLVQGQGVLFFRCAYGDPCKISLLNGDKTDGLSFQFTPINVFSMGIANGNLLTDPNCKSGLINIDGAYYWVSLDSQNQRICAGIGEARIENKIYEYQWNWTPEQDDARRANKKFLETLVNIEVIQTVEAMALLRDPITLGIPMLVRNTDDLSIDDVASGNYLPHSNLDTIGQKLFDCVSGKKFVLDDDSFPDFSKAIEYSISTPGLWCYERLKQKATEFNKEQPNIYETYLRITIGENNGESPGIPYVIEIWPVGHYSPIHNHAGANAIIRVLHGSINVSLFSFLCNKNGCLEPFAKVNFNKEDITWISPTLNQVHQLKNLDTSTDTCITIQCYMYDLSDNKHYDYFDYIDANGNIQQYEPDSDMDFTKFKQLIFQEWKTRINSKLSIDYNSMTLAELKKLCKDRKIKGASKLKRYEIIELLKK